MADTGLHKKDPLSIWVEDESIRSLMDFRRSNAGLNAIVIMCMAAILRETVNPFLVIAWLVASLLVLAGRLYIKHLHGRQYATAHLSEKVRLINTYDALWITHALTWGVSGWLFFTTAPPQNQYLCRAILAIVGYFAVVNLSARPKLARKFINIFMSTQLVGAVWYMGIQNQFQSPPLQYAHVFGLLSIWYVLMMLINKLFQDFYKNNALLFQNNSLIQVLKMQSQRLEDDKLMLSQANETIKRFYSSAAHDIRQPVYALNVYADLMVDEPKQALKLIPKIKASCQAINALFHSLFDYEKIHAGQINVTVKSLDLAKKFKEVQTHFQPLAEAKNIQLRVMPITGVLESDPYLIQGILHHLVANAIKYTHEGGVLVAARKRGHLLSFEVWDTGIGIEPRHQSHIFEEFFKVNEQSSADEGFGLGLSVVKRLSTYIEGASISMKSQLGRGSVFKFQVPLTMYSNG